MAYPVKFLKMIENHSNTIYIQILLFAFVFVHAYVHLLGCNIFATDIAFFLFGFTSEFLGSAVLV